MSGSAQVHGTSRPADPATGARDALVFAMYHPAFALYDGSNRATLETDIAGLPSTLLAARARREQAADEPLPAELERPSPAAGAAEVVLSVEAVTNPAGDVPPAEVAQVQDPAALFMPSGQPSEPDADQLTLF